jgi:hypothetical protein
MITPNNVFIMSKWKEEAHIKNKYSCMMLMILECFSDLNGKPT